MAHYFESPARGLAAGERAQEVPLRIGGREVRLATAPGVFSGSRVDPGTAVLLDAVDFSGRHGDLLDIGCGYGPLSLTMASFAPDATVWAVDVNDRALELCRANAQRLGLNNVRVCRPEQVPAEIRFRFVCSNPAIRIGKPKLHAMLSHWLGRLEPDGEAYLVVQRNLGSDSLHRWLVEQGWPTTRVTSVRGYRVLQCLPRPS
jgi:16S rRNA (guanine1207-N2)-methyltransferase